jgi:hypothetical protein
VHELRERVIVGLIGVEVKFQEGISAAISYEDDSILHTCELPTSHLISYEPVDESVPFLVLLISRDPDIGWAKPPRLSVWPSVVGLWRYQCGETDLLGWDPRVPGMGANIPAMPDAPAVHWIERGMSGVAFYLNATERTVLNFAGAKTKQLVLEAGDLYWIEAFGASESYPVLMLDHNDVTLSFPTAKTWTLTLMVHLSTLKFAIKDTR